MIRNSLPATAAEIREIVGALNVVMRIAETRVTAGEVLAALMWLSADDQPRIDLEPRQAAL